MLRVIKKFYHKNKKICQIGIVAVIISFSYIVTYNMEDYLGIEPLYAFMNNISISYLAAVIFYIVQVYIPTTKNENKSLEILRIKFQNLIEYIEVITYMCEKYIEVYEKGAKINWTDDNCIIFKYHKSGNEKNNTIKSFTKCDLQNIGKKVEGMINDIRETSVFNFCDYDVIKLVSEIEDHPLYGTISNIATYSDSELNFSALSSQIEGIRKHISSMKSIYDIQWTLVIDDADAGDKVLARLTTQDMSKFLRNLDALNKEIQKARIKEQIKASNFNIDISDELIEELYDKLQNNKNDPMDNK